MKLISSDSIETDVSNTRETLEVGGLQYLLMTDTEASEDDFSESSFDGGSDSEALDTTDNTFGAPIPELNLDGLTTEQLSSQLTDVRNQFRHMKFQFGKVLQEKADLQASIDSLTAEIKFIRENNGSSSVEEIESPRIKKEKESVKRQASAKDRRGSATQRRLVKQNKRAAKEKALLQKFYNWIPFSTANQLEMFSLLEITADPCSSGNAEVLIDQSHELVLETFRSLLGWGCFVDSGTRAPFLNDLITAFKICFVVCKFSFYIFSKV